MPYEPLVLLRRLAPEEVDKLIRQNPLPINPSQNAQINDNQEEEKDVVSNNSILPTKNQKKFSRSSPKLRVLSTNLNSSSRDVKFVDELQRGKPLKKQNHEISLKNHNEITYTDKTNVACKDIFNKELFVVIENGINEVIRDMVNSTAQHPKLRKRTNSTINNRNSTSNNSASSTRDRNIVKERRTHESIMRTTTKTSLSTVTPVIEVIKKKTKEITLTNQHHKTADEFNKQTKYNKVQRDDFFGINLRTRTISTTIPPLNHSIGSTTVQPNRPRSRRGRPPRQKNINVEANVPKSPVPASLDRLQRKRSVNQCNGNSNVQKNQNKNVTVINIDADCRNSLLSGDEKNEDCVIVDVVCKKKINSRKRKQSDIGEAVARKRICNNQKGSLVKEKNLIEKSLPKKPALVVKTVNYGFLSGYDFIKPYRQHTGSNPFPSTLYGRTNWPISWEYSASSLTSHVQKKVSKDILRKIRLICNNGTITKPLNAISAPKKKSTLKKNQPSVVQIRDSSSKLTKLASIVKRQKGRPPGRKNKLIQSVKSSCPRKSPRQHASTLAAIMSTKTSNSDKLVNQPDNLMDFDVDCNINSLDNEGPCILTMAVPNLEHNMSSECDRHHGQLDDKPGNIKSRRRRRCRSITPSPPKLCAQIPLTQRAPVNTLDHEVVKLRTKHVDVVKRRARDERLRTAFVYQQLQKIQEIAEENRCELLKNVLPNLNEKELGYQFSSSSVLLQTGSSQDQVWSTQMDNDLDLEEPNNMSLQIMYEQTGDKRFLCTDLTNETLQIYYQQRELALAERLTNNYNSETVSSDLGIDTINASNKRKKKRPNMTGWPKEKRRKVVSNNTTSVISSEPLNGNNDVGRNNIAKRRKAAEKQKLRRQRLKLEQQHLVKNKLKIKESTKIIPKRRPGRPKSLKKKNKPETYQRSPSLSSNSTVSSTISSKCTIKEKKLRKQKQKRLHIENKKVTEVVPTGEPNRVVKRSCGRPRGSGWRQRLKLELLQRHRNQTSLSSVQQKENVQEQISTGKLKCVISTRNNRMKLLSTSGSSTSATSSQKKTIGNKSKKPTDSYNVSSSCLVPLPVTEVIGKATRTTAKRKRLVGSWEVGRPKRYTTNHGRNSNCVEEDCCFVGSQPFEQHCPGVGGLSHNTVLENRHDHQKENSNTFF
ncbi:Hypothetical protein CINCED_3A019160 [Cinara cedri]|uniref:Uncharacterized protein n=1 Tax=Cinara cedri TaxID=506608 RepID=A0A5E4LYW9_9HEMI|nr:Hypothetical protein CINCED_3A019160 [Cinara cedri]